jgi:hypothetical protein
VLEIDAWPELREPVLVLALQGWVDAGNAGMLAATSFAGQLVGSRVFARYEIGDLVDLAQTRPRVEIEGGTRRIIWPTIEFTAGAANRDVVVCVGPEPSLRWPTFVTELTELFVRLGVSYACTLGGVPTLSSHRLPISIVTVAGSHELAQEVGAMSRDYEGPIGVQTVLQMALAEAGIPAVGLWAQVPHYVAGNPSPPAVRALLARLAELTGVRPELTQIDEQVEGYLSAIEDGLAERPDVAQLVQAIEDEVPPDPVSGDVLAAEIERFLRGQ